MKVRERDDGVRTKTDKLSLKLKRSKYNKKR